MDARVQRLLDKTSDIIQNFTNLIGLRQYFEKSWDGAFSTIEDVNAIFSDYYDVKLVPELINSRRFKDENTIILHVKARDIDVNSLHDVCIYIKSGAPTWQDYAEVTFGEGKEADLRIIVHDDDYDRGDENTSPGDSLFMAKLVRHNNQCAFPTALINVGGIEGKSGIKGRLIYSCMEEPKNCSIPDSKTLPTMRELLNADFCHNYYLRLWGAEPDPDEDICFNEWWGSYCYHGDLRTEARWNDEGLLLSFFGSPDSQEIKWIWDNRENIFRNTYVDCPITLSNEEGKPYGVSVRALDIPMRDLLEMPPMQKWQYADMLVGNEHTFSGIIDEALVEYDEVIKKESKRT